jgi:ribosomal protein L16
VPTGGSLRGTTVVWGTWGIRLTSPGGRVSATQLRIADAAIARSLRAAGAQGAYTVFRRVNAGVAVYTKGSDQRMGKGKGGFDYWCARVARGRVVFEVSGKVHERVVREALRIAGNKLPGELGCIYG